MYLTLVSSPDESGTVTLGVQINPMVLWLWVGGAVMAFGTLVALIPARRRSVLPAAVREPELVEAAT